MKSYHAAALSPRLTVAIIVLAGVSVFCFTLFFAAHP
jgi:hypothetical protein